jgi:hypothetical protein
MHYLIYAQAFDGSWAFTASLLSVLGGNAALFEAEIAGGVDKTVLVTGLVVVVFEERFKEQEGAWELVVEKAKEWLQGEIDDRIKEVLGRAKRVLGC